MELLLDHVHDIEVIEPCCNSADRDESGYIACGCGGMKEYRCADPNCPGVDDSELDDFIDHHSFDGFDCD